MDCLWGARAIGDPKICLLRKGPDMHYMNLKAHLQALVTMRRRIHAYVFNEGMHFKNLLIPK
jgi:hypothetical protein